MRVIVRRDEIGNYTYAADEPVDLILVDEAIPPSDRCYRLKQNGPALKIGREFVDEILGSDPITHFDDGRHPDLLERIEKIIAELPPEAGELQCRGK